MDLEDILLTPTRTEKHGDEPSIEMGKFVVSFGSGVSAAKQLSFWQAIGAGPDYIYWAEDKEEENT